MVDRPAVFNWSDPEAVARWTANPSPGNAARPQQLAITLTLLAQVQPRGLRLLDLGCGDGAVAEMALARLPGSYVVGVDLSPPMLEAAERRLAPYAGRYRLYRRALTATEPLPGEAPFDAAMGVQSVHHLTAEEKRGLFRWVADQLRPRGLLLLSDRVRLPSAALFPYYHALYATQQAALRGPAPPAGYGYAAHLRALALEGDQPDTVEDQLDWMREAGFGEAGCFYRYVERAIFGGLKTPPGPPDQPYPDDRSGALMAESPTARRGL